MWFLDKLNAAIWGVLLHPQDKVLSFFSCIFNFIFVAGAVELQSIVSVSFGRFFLTFSQFLCLDINSSDGLQDGNIEGCLAKLVKHEKMVGQVGELGLESEPV